MFVNMTTLRDLHFWVKSSIYNLKIAISTKALFFDQLRPDYYFHFRIISVIYEKRKYAKKMILYADGSEVFTVDIILPTNSFSIKKVDWDTEIYENWLSYKNNFGHQGCA